MIDTQRKYATWQVMRLLERHPTWRFKSPANEKRPAARAHKVFASSTWVTFQQQDRINGKWEPMTLSKIDERVDWVRVYPVKLKRERVKVAEVATDGSLNISLHSFRAFSELANEGWYIYAVKRKSS